MKLLQKYINVSVMILLLCSIAACAGDDPQPDTPTPKTQQELVTESWKVISVIREGQNIESNTFKIDFKPNNTYEFTTTGIPGLPQTGNWAFQTAPNGNIIKLDEAIDLKIIGQITQTSFIFEYIYSNHKTGPVVVRFTLGPP